MRDAANVYFNHSPGKMGRTVKIHAEL